MSLQIKICFAVLSHDTEMFSNMDPYCVLTLGRQEYRSRTVKEGGKKPVWNQTFNFGGMDNKLLIKVMDEDTFTDDLIGEASLDLTKFRSHPQQHKEIVELRFKGNSAGKLQLNIKGEASYQSYAKPSTPLPPQQIITSPGLHSPGLYSPQVKPVSSHGMQNHGMQVLQGMNSGNQLVPPQKATLKSPDSLFGDLSRNNGWGDFDPSRAPQNNSLGIGSKNSAREENPFSMLGDALSKRGGLGSVMSQSQMRGMGSQNPMTGMGLAGYQSLSQPQMMYGPGGYYPGVIFR